MKIKRLSNQYLNVVATLGNVVLSKPIKPMHAVTAVRLSKKFLLNTIAHILNNMTQMLFKFNNQCIGIMQTK